jgi:hypothetical protein
MAFHTAVHVADLGLTAASKDVNATLMYRNVLRRELSRTHNVCLFMDTSAEVMQKQAEGVDITQLFFIIEDLLSGQSNTSASSLAPPFVLGHILEYKDAAGTHCLDLCNHCTVLNPSILSLGECSWEFELPRSLKACCQYCHTSVSMPS